MQSDSQSGFLRIRHVTGYMLTALNRTTPDYTGINRNKPGYTGLP
jgi:hypothetical protein